MPILDGFGAAREMREHEKVTDGLSKIIIGISASSESSGKNDARAAGNPNPNS